MKTEQRIDLLAALGQRVESVLKQDGDADVYWRSQNGNPWFTEEFVRYALKEVKNSFLSRPALESWLAGVEPAQRARKVGLVLAGNLPLVGLHDFLAVFASGHHAQMKLSSKDQVLLNWLLAEMLALEPLAQQQFEVVERLSNIEAVIATGSGNTARYFEYYFGKYPNIIRKNRYSLAILDGAESDDELKGLGRDIFLYFGLGCRSVSKLLVPEGYDFQALLPHFQSYEHLIHHHKYSNNYTYQKSILLVNKEAHFDNGFLLVRESEQGSSPISVLHYQTYKSQEELKEIVEAQTESLQCVVGKSELSTVAFGESQKPGLKDYADGVDTLSFLKAL